MTETKYLNEPASARVLGPDYSPMLDLFYMGVVFTY